VQWPYGAVGYVLATEEHPTSALVRNARLAEKAGFGFFFISDHFHPWTVEFGYSSYLWSLLGALSTVTQNTGLVSAVTCPILRVHPTTLAQAASTVAHLSNGRFILGLGTGEKLNEDIVGGEFPAFPERLERLEEAMEHVRALLTGEEVSLEGHYFRTSRARLFDPHPDVPIFLAASGSRAATLASEKSDGLICLGARPRLRETFSARNRGPAVAQLSVCWAEDEWKAAELARAVFPQVAMPGTLFAELSTPEQFEQAAHSITVDDVRAAIVCGPSPQPYLQAIEECFESGFQAVAIHQIGPDQQGFFKFWERVLGPAIESTRLERRKGSP